MSTREAVVASSTGGPEVLRRETLELLPLGSGDIRIRTRLLGVNFWDVMQRRGDVPLPADSVPGVEGVGTVIETGSDVDQALVGQRVAWSRVPSSYATVLQGPAASFVAVPDGVSDEAAAAVLMQGITAHYLAESTTALEPGEVAVVTAAAGGVGGLLVQLLRARGVTVIGVVGSEAKRSAAESCGASVIVDSESLVADVRALHPGGAAAVFDANGGDTSRLLGLLRARGICVLYGSAAGPIAPIDAGALAAGSLYLTRCAGRDYTSAPGEWRMRADDVLRRMKENTLSPSIFGVHPLNDAADVHRMLEGRLTTGKILLVP